MKMTSAFNEEGVMKNGKQFRKQAKKLAEKAVSMKNRKRNIEKGHVDNKKLNKPTRGYRIADLLV